MYCQWVPLYPPVDYPGITRVIPSELSQWLCSYNDSTINIVVIIIIITWWAGVVPEGTRYPTGTWVPDKLPNRVPG